MSSKNRFCEVPLCWARTFYLVWAHLSHRLAVSSLTAEDYPHVVGVFVRVWIGVRTLLLSSLPIRFWFCDCTDIAHRSRFKRKRFSRHRSVTPPSRPDAVLVICVSIVALYCSKIAD